MEKNTEMYLRDAAGALATIRKEERRIQALVNRARETGATWTEVGRYLDMSKQTAFARYGKTRTDAPAPDLETSKITDADRAGTSETPSIFSDAPFNDDANQGGPETRIFCPFCMSNIGKAAKPQALELFRGEHAQFGSGEEATCAHALEKNLDKPYYTATDRPWQSGWKATK